MLSYPSAAAELMEHLCEHYSHGYSQYSRLGDGGKETVTLSDGTMVTIATGDRDCSSAVIDCYQSLGVDCGGASYTGNMRSCMTSTGNFKWYPMSSGYIAQRGDIYLNEVHHTAMCLSAVPDMLAQFSISENGTIDGAEGDQTGYESNIKPYYDYPWDGKLVYCGPAREGGSNVNQGTTTIPAGDSQPSGDGVVYQAHTLAHGWLEQVNRVDGTEDGYAGWQGSPIDAIRAYANTEIKIQTHMLGGGWNEWTTFNGSLWGYNSSGAGMSGDYGIAIDGVRVRGCQCRVLLNGTWQGWMQNGRTPNGDDFCGVYGMPVRGIQMRL